jgi:hypothetical protein
MQGIEGRKMRAWLGGFSLFLPIATILYSLGLLCSAAAEDPCAFVKRTRVSGFEPGTASFFSRASGDREKRTKEICLILDGETCYPNNMYDPGAVEHVNFEESNILPKHFLSHRSRKKSKKPTGPLTGSGSGKVEENEVYFEKVKSISCKSGKCLVRENKCYRGMSRNESQSIDVDEIVEAAGGQGQDSLRPTKILLILALSLYPLFVS